MTATADKSSLKNKHFLWRFGNNCFIPRILFLVFTYVMRRPCCCTCHSSFAPTWPQWRCCWLRPCLSFLMYFAEHELGRNNFWELNIHICDFFVAIIVSSAVHSISLEEGLNVRNRLHATTNANEYYLRWEILQKVICGNGTTPPG